VLVAEGDATGLATAMQGLLEDPERRSRMGIAARERISREFPIDKMEKGYVRLIEDLVR
jgi:glycosyltransferase involved in cell wall biosynthesis